MRLLKRRLAVGGVAAALIALSAAANAYAATDFVGVNDVVVTSGSPVNASRSFIDVSSTFKPTDNTWLYRVIVKHDSNRAQVGVGNSVGNSYSACPSDWNAASSKGYWEWTSSSTSSCGLFANGLSSEEFEVGRESSTSSAWELIAAGVTRQTTGSLFNTLTDVEAGGYIFGDTTKSLSATYGPPGNGPWQRSSDPENVSQSWTTIQNSQQIVEASWSVGAPPSPFAVRYN
jgi:hypothetical protein